MIEEQAVVTIIIVCDRARCTRAQRVVESSREAANSKLYDLGWRVANDKHLCPHHVQIRHKQQAAREQKS
jgi:hypothetical protein